MYDSPVRRHDKPIHLSVHCMGADVPLNLLDVQCTVSIIYVDCTFQMNVRFKCINDLHGCTSKISFFQCTNLVRKLGPYLNIRVRRLKKKFSKNAFFD